MGIMIFNMGGHPGQGVCKRLFERRGLRVNKLWQTKVMQAADTDISALVEIEKNSPHRFEFFMGLAGDLPICALDLWKGWWPYFSCFISLQLSASSTKSGTDERIPFLAYLSSILKENSFLPYEPPAGSRGFRSLVARFVKNYRHIPLGSDVVIQQRY